MEDIYKTLTAHESAELPYSNTNTLARYDGYWGQFQTSMIYVQHPTSPKPQYPILNEPKIPIPNTDTLL